MAITTEDGVVAGLQAPATFLKASFTGEAAGNWHNLGAVAGIPGAWTLGAPGLAGATVTTSTLGGALTWANPASGEARLGRASVGIGANIVGIMFYDLLWYNTGLAEATTTAQTVNSVAWPARDAAGTTNGAGVEIWLMCTTATTNAAAVTNTTYSYTNQAGTAGRSAGLVPNWPATAVAGTAVPFGLQGSDTGVRSVQSITLGTSYVAGQVDAFAIRRLSTIYFPAASSGLTLDWAQLGFPKAHNDSAVYMMVLLSGTAAGTTQGEINWAHG